MRFSIVAAAFLATAVSAADYGYGAPSSSPSASPSTTAVVYSSVVTKHETVTVDCKKDPYNCPHKPTTTANLHPTGVYGNGSHPVYTPTYPIVPKPPHGGNGGYGNGGHSEDDKYILSTITTTLCVPTTSTYVTKVLKPTTTPAEKPTGTPVPVPTGGYKATPTLLTTGAASSLQMGSFAVVAGVAAFILA